MSPATQTRTAQLLSAEQLRQQQETSGREGLANLLAAVRRMMSWLLMPFRVVARVLFHPKQQGAGEPAVGKTNQAERAAGPAISSADDVALHAMASAKDATTSTSEADPEFAGLAKQIAENPNGGLDIEVSGAPDDLDEVLPLLMRLIDQILKTHLPSDAAEARVASHLVALAETAECARYAHRLVSREVDGALKAVLNDKKYFGLSASTVQDMVLAAAQSPGAASAFGEGSAEQRFLARLAVREKLESDFAMQTQQMAVALAPVMGEANSVGELQGRAKEMLDDALKAAVATRSKMQVRQAMHGATRGLPETLPELPAALNRAIIAVAEAVAKKHSTNGPEARPQEAGEELAVAALAKAVAAVTEPAGESVDAVEPAGASAVESTTTNEAEMGELVAITESEAAGIVVAATAASAEAAEKPVMQAAEAAVAPGAATAPVVAGDAALAKAAPVTKAAEAVKNASVAVQAVRAAGMFGGAAAVQRTAAELAEAEADLIDDAFVVEEGDNLVSG